MTLSTVFFDHKVKNTFTNLKDYNMSMFKLRISD